MITRYFTIADSKYSKELIKLDFPSNLLTDTKQAKDFLDYCKENDMKFLKGSYGTLVHKEFDKYFRFSENRKLELELQGIDELTGKSNFDLNLDHDNFFEFKIKKDMHILTSSPYDTVPNDIRKETKDYPYNVYAINPYFINYIGYIEHKKFHPFYDLSYAYTSNSNDEINQINEVIYSDLGILVFLEL